MSNRPRLLDLFCSAGGAGMGYYRAGFDVTGVDHKPQPRYPFSFVQADALAFLAEYGDQYDVIHASPPCQAHTRLRHLTKKDYPELIPSTRRLLQRAGRPYVIENVPGAPLRSPAVLCGTTFGLGVGDAELRRHRWFESNWMLLCPPCHHGDRRQAIAVTGTGHGVGSVISVHGANGEDSRLRKDRSTISIHGTGGGEEARARYNRTAVISVTGKNGGEDPRYANHGRGRPAVISIHGTVGEQKAGEYDAQYRPGVIVVAGEHGFDPRYEQRNYGGPSCVSVHGHAGGHSTRSGRRLFSVDECREAMGIPWMTQAELSQAIPPAYTEWIGRALRETAL